MNKHTDMKEAINVLEMVGMQYGATRNYAQRFDDNTAVVAFDIRESVMNCSPDATRPMLSKMRTTMLSKLPSVSVELIDEQTNFMEGVAGTRLKRVWLRLKEEPVQPYPGQWRQLI
jgi:hypothetical protein